MLHLRHPDHRPGELQALCGPIVNSVTGRFTDANSRPENRCHACLTLSAAPEHHAVPESVDVDLFGALA